MNKPIFAALAVVTLLAALPAQTNDPAKRAGLQKAYARLEKVIVQKNFRAIMAMSTPQMTWVQPDGKVLNHQAYAAMVKGWCTMPMRFSTVSMKNDSFDFDGNVARVRSNTLVVMEMKNEQGQWQNVRVASQSVDTWHWTKKGWMLHRVDVVSETYGD